MLQQQLPGGDPRTASFSSQGVNQHIPSTKIVSSNWTKHSRSCLGEVTVQNSHLERVCKGQSNALLWSSVNHSLSSQYLYQIKPLKHLPQLCRD